MNFVKKQMLLFKYFLWKKFYSLIHHKSRKEKVFAEKESKKIGR